MHVDRRTQLPPTHYLHIISSSDIFSRSSQVKHLAQIALGHRRQRLSVSPAVDDSGAGSSDKQTKQTIICIKSQPPGAVVVGGTLLVLNQIRRAVQRISWTRADVSSFQLSVAAAASPRGRQ